MPVDGVWRIETDDGHANVERTDGAADIEVSVKFLAPLFTGLLRPDTVTAVGAITVRREGAIERAAEVFAVTHPPYCADMY